MGNGFAFVARQKALPSRKQRFLCRPDSIFHSVARIYCHRIESHSFQAGICRTTQLYINVVDDKLRGEYDNKTIGLLLCRGKDEVVAQYALSGYDQPIGISDYQLSKAIPEKLKSALPSVEEVEEELASFLDKDPKQ